MLYENRADPIYDVPGQWHLRSCANHDCGLIWLDPRPVDEDIGLAYVNFPPTGREKTDRTSSVAVVAKF